MTNPWKVANAIYKVHGCKSVQVDPINSFEVGDIEVETWRVDITYSDGDTDHGAVTVVGDQVWLHMPDGTQATHLPPS